MPFFPDGGRPFAHVRRTIQHPIFHQALQRCLLGRRNRPVSSRFASYCRAISPSWQSPDALLRLIIHPLLSRTQRLFHKAPLNRCGELYYVSLNPINAATSSGAECCVLRSSASIILSYPFPSTQIASPTSQMSMNTSSLAITLHLQGNGGPCGASP